MLPRLLAAARAVFRAFPALLPLFVAAGAVAQNPIHVTYLWHMHQPIYFPYETVSQTDFAGRFNFSVRGVHDARTGAYGEWPKNAVQQGTDIPHAGVQVSFSGSLMENMDGLYGFGWRDHYRWGRNGLRTTRNNPRLDLVGIAYHHSLMPLTPKESMRMQIRLHKEAYKDVWNTGGSYSKGFWPPECAFDVNMIPALVDEGIQWVIVDNGHFDRACEGYPWAPASSIRPNKADQLNPDPVTLGSQWVQLNNVWAPTKVSAPWGYQPRYVQYVDPNSSPANPVVRKIIAVPAGRYEGNENARGGYGAFKPENVWTQHLARNNDPQRPMLILCHSDGDNFGMLNADAYNGQHGNFLNMVRSNPAFEHTSVQDYLELYPVPANDVIHVEPGTWVGIDGGTPYYDKWRENNPRDGEHPDLWSWSVLVAAANRVIHADDLENAYSMNDVRWGIGPDTAKAWHFYLQAETSCHWYWDFDRANPWDGNATRGANLAIAEANKVIARNAATDRVGPTIWPPQRDIYNPGGLQYNEATPASNNFKVFTFIDDVNGVQTARLHWRIDSDGRNPINEYDNELYAHNPAKNGAWNVVDMPADWYPAVRGPQVPNPANRAMRFQASINGQNNVLIDYFVEAIDTRGNVSRSDIEQVWVGAANDGGGSGAPVVTTPATPVAGQPVTITYNPAGRSLAAATTVNLHHGFNGGNWTALPGVAMTKQGDVWTFTYTVPANATTLALVFNNGSGVWDNNGGLNWNFTVSEPPPAPVFGATEIELTDPLLPAQVTAATYLFRGRAGSAFTGGLTWTNPLTGANGLVAFPGGDVSNGWEWSVSIPLGAGANSVTFSGTHATSTTESFSDSPANYTAWSNGSTGGTGFGAWTLTSTGTAGHFLAESAANLSLGAGATKGFGLWASPGATSTATRDFATPMAPGDSFTLRFDNNWIDNGGETGFALADATGAMRLRFHFVGGQSNYRVTDAVAARDTGWPYTADGLALTFTLTSATAYTLSNGTTTLTGNLAAGGAVSRVIIENKSAGPGTERNLYVGTLTHARPVAGTAAVQANAATLTRSAVGYELWRAGRPADNDLLRDYAIGGAGTPDARGEPPQIQRDGTQLALVAIVRTGDPALSVTPEVATDLAGPWLPVDPAAVSAHADQTGVPEGCVRKIVRVTPSGDRTFLRFSITHTP